MDALDRLTLQVLAEQAPLTPLALLLQYLDCTRVDDGQYVYEHEAPRWTGLLICAPCAVRADYTMVAHVPPHGSSLTTCCACGVTLNPV